MDEATKGLLEEGNQARIDGDYDKALPLLEEAVRASPDVAKCWWALGHVLLNSGDFDVAISRFEKAVELDPDDLLFALDIAKSLEMLGEFERAQPVLERIVELDPSSKEAAEARKSLAYY